MGDGGYDGTIRINTKIDSAGFNQGAKKMTGGLAGVMATIKKIQSALASAFTGGGFGLIAIATGFKNILGTIFNIGKSLAKVFSTSALLLFGASLMAIVQSIRSSMGELFERAGLTPQIDEITARFEELKMAVANAFLPLVVAALPYIRQAINWLTDMFNKIAMITAAFMGQKTVMQIVAGSAKKIADNTKKAAKEAKGALAAFDQLNVLQKPDQPQAEDVTTTDTVLTKTVPVTSDILSMVGAIKKEIDGWITDPWGKIQEYWGYVAEWFKTNVTDPIVNWWNQSWLKLNIWDPIYNWAVDVYNKLVTLWNDPTLANALALGWAVLKPIWDGLVTYATWAFGNLMTILGFIWDGIVAYTTWAWGNLQTILKFIWDGLVAYGTWAFGNLVSIPQGAWDAITAYASWAWNNLLTILKGIWGLITSYVTWAFGNLVYLVGGGFATDLKNAWSSTWNWIASFTKNIINTIIGFIEGMTAAITTGINSVITGINSVQIGIPGFSVGAAIPLMTAPQIPRLATGAVIPPNAQFAAILGDQKNGYNLEGPEDMFRRIVREESGQRGDQQITIKFTGSMAELIKVLKPELDRETRRTGNSLVKGFTV